VATVRSRAGRSVSFPPAKPTSAPAVWQRRDGFTFLELSVVVVIMGIVMAVTLPRFTSTFSKATLGGTARRLAGTMAYLRNAAARDGRSYFLNIDLDNHEYWVAVFNEEMDLSQIDFEVEDTYEEMYTEFSDGFAARTRLQKKIEFAEVLLGDGEKIFDGILQIEFRPNGTTDEVVIHLTNPKERFYTVYLEGYNGQATAYKHVFVPEPLPVLDYREPLADPKDAL